MAITFAVCVEKTALGDFSSDDVTVGKLYEVIDSDAGHGMMRIVDDSGEDYLYPTAWFEPVVVGEASASRLHRALMETVNH